MWGDAAIGFTGMDFETAVRERIPIMSVLLNNFSMAIGTAYHEGLDREVPARPTSRATTPPWRAPSAATASGVTKPEDIVPAIKRGIEQTKKGVPVLLEFITSKEVTISRSRKSTEELMTIILSPTGEHRARRRDGLWMKRCRRRQGRPGGR